MIVLRSRARKSDFAELIDRPIGRRNHICATKSNIVYSGNSEEDFAVSEWSVSVDSRVSTRYCRGARSKGTSGITVRNVSECCLISSVFELMLYVCRRKAWVSIKKENKGDTHHLILELLKRSRANRKLMKHERLLCISIVLFEWRMSIEDGVTPFNTTQKYRAKCIHRSSCLGHVRSSSTVSSKENI